MACLFDSSHYPSWKLGEVGSESLWGCDRVDTERMSAPGENGSFSRIQENSLASMTQEKMARFVYGGYQKSRVEKVSLLWMCDAIGKKREAREGKGGGGRESRRVFGVCEDV